MESLEEDRLRIEASKRKFDPAQATQYQRRKREEIYW